jgi:O-antigen/teichoic acid export membrane protein
MDQLVLSVSVSSHDLGLYAAASSYLALMLPVVTAVAVVSFTDSASGKIPQAVIRRSLRLGAIISCVSAAGLALMSPLLIPLLFGDTFAHAIRLSVILAFGAAGSGVRLVSSALLRGRGRQNLAALLEGALLVALTLAILEGAHLRGAEGVATAYSAIQIVFAFTSAVVLLSSLTKTAPTRQAV